MSSGDVRKLIGGYATGTLTEAERKLLFEAALEDQELFDELAGEQELKDLLDDRGVRQRLIASLSPAPKRPLWTRPWPWAGAAAAALVLIVVVALLPRAPAPKQLAELRTYSAPAAAPSVEQAPPRIPPAQASARPRIAAQIAKAPELAQSRAAPKDEHAAAPANQVAALDRAEQVPEPPAPAAAAGPPPPPPAQAAVSAPPAQGGGGTRGAVAGFRPFAAESAGLLKRSTQARFAFDYEVLPDGKLRVVPAANGFLSVSAPPLEFSNRVVQAGVAAEIPLPADAKVAQVILSAQPLQAGAASAIGSTERDGTSGTKVDPSPSPTSRVTAVIQLNR